MTELSITSLGKPIAQGATAEVYAWKDGQVLKLFHKRFGSGAVEYEAKIARAVHAAGIPVPAVGEIIKVDSRSGLVYERTDGSTMGQVLERKPWKVFTFARLLAELQADMHASGIAPEIPSQRQRMEQKIQNAKALPDALKEVIVNALEHMPDGEQLCHGDFHPYNILMTVQGPVIIDWVDATRGNPVADVVRSSVLIEGAVAAMPSIKWRNRKVFHWMHAIYRRHYFRLCPDAQQQAAAWWPIIAAASMSGSIPEVQEWLLAQVKAGLS